MPVRMLTYGRGSGAGVTQTQSRTEPRPQGAIIRREFIRMLTHAAEKGDQETASNRLLSEP
jgi:hypothetical protein